MSTKISPYPSSFFKPTSTYSSQSAIKFFAPLLVLAAGTGGMMTAQSTAELNRWVYDPRIHVESSKVNQVDMRSPAEHVANIRDIFSINMSDLASVLGVTRPTVYAWLEGQEPKAEAVTHIEQLSRTADTFNRASIIRLDKLVHRPILNGRSLLDMLKTDEDLLTALDTLKAVANKEAKSRHEPKGISKHLRSLDDVLGESSVAIYERS